MNWINDYLLEKPDVVLVRDGDGQHVFKYKNKAFAAFVYDDENDDLIALNIKLSKQYNLRKAYRRPKTTWSCLSLSDILCSDPEDVEEVLDLAYNKITTSHA